MEFMMTTNFIALGHEKVTAPQTARRLDQELVSFPFAPSECLI